MSKIKTRESVKDIKALDKAATAAERMAAATAKPASWRLVSHNLPG